MSNMKNLNQNCLMCRKSCLNSPSKTKRSLRLDNNNKSSTVLKAWKDECATATCEFLFGEKSDKFVHFFQSANYCSFCQQLVRDTSFTWKKIQCFQKRLDGLSTKIIKILNTNYQLIKDKSQPNVLEERISLLLNTDVPLRYQTYEEMVEIIYSVASIDSKLPFDIQNSSELEDCPKSPDVKHEEISDSEAFLQDNLSNSMSFHEDVDEKPEIKSELSDCNNEELSGRLQRENLKNEKANDDHKHGTPKLVSSHRKIRPCEAARKKSNTFQKSYGSRKSEWTKNLMYTKRNKFVCSEKNCGKRFLMEETMKIHVLKVHKGESKPLKCVKCLMRFTYQHHLTRHVRDIHDKGKTVRNYGCSFCGKKFPSTSDRDLHHSSFHKEPNPFQCAFCPEIYHTSDGLKKHTKETHHNPHECKVCDITFSSFNLLMDHRRNEHSYFCSICNKTFASSSGLSFHMKIKHNVKATVLAKYNFECKFCAKGYLEENELNVHYSEAHQDPNPFACAFCPEICTNSVDLSKHMESVHSDPTDPTKICKRKRIHCRCSVCGRRFINVSSLNEHMKQHNLSGLEKCEICSKCFKTARALAVHKYSLHLEGGYSCEICGIVFSNAYILNHHKISTHPENLKRKRIPTATPQMKYNFQCKYCFKGYLEEEDLNLHYTEAHQGPNPFTCAFCPEICTNSVDLGKHMDSVHSDPTDPSKICKRKKSKNIMCRCCVCGRRYVTAALLNEHLKQHSNLSEFEKCEICGECFKTPRGLTIHKTSMHLKGDYPCEICGIVFSNAYILRNHSESTHPETLLPKQIRIRTPKQMVKATLPLLNYNFECKFCSKGFVEEEDMNAHYSEAHQGPNPFACAYCTEIFSNSVDLRKHMDSVHPDPNRLAGKLKCETCGKYYANEQSLRHHSLSHVAPVLYKCHLCSSTFKSKYYLNTHVENHDGERKFVCETCGKNFKTAAYLRQHAKTHDESQKKYKCKVCDKKFFMRLHCLNHERIHTDLKEFVCHLCGKSFNRDCNLAEHLKIHAGVPTSRKKKTKSTNVS